MTARKGYVPLSWIERSGEVCRLNQLAAVHIWNAICDTGHDPEQVVMRFKELGDGRLAVGCYEDEEVDFKQPIKGLGFILPMGFWYTTDDRMPLNWIHSRPPPNYGPPGIGKPIDPSYYTMWTDSPNG